MEWLNQLGGMLQQYSGASAQRAPQSVNDDFDNFAQAAPHGTIAEALSEAFRSDQTPAFGQMAGQLFGHSNGSQRASILNTLISTLGPTLVAQLLSRGGSSGLASMLGGGHTQLTPEQAEQVSPEEVQEIAARAEQKDPSIIDTFSNFYAEHPTLIKTLGGAALTVALAKIAQRHSGL
ncbi:MAG TPA: hypothetical protein VNH22_08290 [Blastocatellia bacterium]|nr:hypothetical protein [Blastocatellia bacterium]